MALADKSDLGAIGRAPKEEKKARYHKVKQKRPDNAFITPRDKEEDEEECVVGSAE